MGNKQIVFESLRDFVTDRLNESFESSNLRKFDGWVKTHLDKNKHSYDINNYLSKGVFCDKNIALKANQLTDENTFLSGNVSDAYGKVEALVEQGYSVGILVANAESGVSKYIARDFMANYDNIVGKCVFLIVANDGSVGLVDRQKPKASKKYNWFGPESQLGNNRESEFKERRNYNNKDTESRKVIDDASRKTAAKWSNNKDMIDNLYPKSGRR
ncbi:MAG: hypothetical protein ACRDD8_15120 [Bacteroidales bacterium]